MLKSMIKKFKTLCSTKTGALLIEVIFTVIIMSVVLVLIIESLMTSYRAIVYSRDYSQALFLQDSKMFELIQNRYVSNSYSQEGTFEAPYEDYSYRVSIENVKEEDGGASRIDEVKVDVLWSSRKDEKVVTASTYLLNQ